MIAEAEKAAEALEVAAVRSPIARASLLETRKLIAEAILSIESIHRGITSPIEAVPILSNQSLPMPQHHAYPLSGQTDHIREERKVNGSAVEIQTLDVKTDKCSFGHPLSCNQLGLEDMVYGSMEDASEIAGPNGLLISKGDPLPSGSETNPRSQEEDWPSKLAINVTKKWFRGRLVDVTEQSSSHSDSHS